MIAVALRYVFMLVLVFILAFIWAFIGALVCEWVLVDRARGVVAVAVVVEGVCRVRVGIVGRLVEALFIAVCIAVLSLSLAFVLVLLLLLLLLLLLP